MSTRFLLGTCVYLREGNGTLLRYSCLESPMDRGAWWAAVHGVAKSRARLGDFPYFSLSCIGEGNGNPLQYSHLENPRDRGVWWAAVYGVAQSQTRLKRFSSSSSVRVEVALLIDFFCFTTLHSTDMGKEKKFFSLSLWVISNPRTING